MTSNQALWMASAAVCTLVLMLLGMPVLIRELKKLKMRQTEREEGLESHKSKTGTPTMGGIGFIVIPFAVYGIFSLFSPYKWNLNTLLIWLSYIGYGLIGFADDFKIVVQKKNDGLSPKMKFALQSLLAVIVCVLYMQNNPTTISIPGNSLSFDAGWFYFLVVFFMFTGASNAVNLADGVDGLCAGLCAIALVPFAILGWLMGYFDTAMICVLVIAGLIGYLFFNWHPAKVFMGDTGSLALGGLLAAVAMVEKMEVLLIVVGMVFIAETLSVIIQVAVFKKTHKRVFRMAPLHHHFEKGGWSETKVVLVFWCFQALFSLAGLLLGLSSLGLLG